MRPGRAVVGALLLLLSPVALRAGQDAKLEANVVMFAEDPASAPPPMDHLIVLPEGQAGNYNTFAYIGAEPPAESNVVKGVPYSAEAITEIVRTLADGNRIVRRNTALIYRDSEGRVRRERTLQALGPWTAEGTPPKTISIFDPVAGLSVTTTDGVAGATAGAQTRRVEAGAFAGGGETFDVKVARPAAIAPHAARTLSGDMPAPVVESLGTQVMEGLQVEGTRSTIVIPAGEIGNEQPIQIVSEIWSSPELQTVVFSHRNDPLIGETTFRLTKINRSEPDPQLFQLPSGVDVHVIQKKTEK